MYPSYDLSEYLHPELYDLENPDFEAEGLFFLSLAQATGGPILELGCGTGRFTIPLAQHGFDVTGLDLVPEMLAAAREKARTAGVKVEWIEADARTFHLQRSFNFIFECGSVFMHMLTNADQRAFLNNVYAHLAQGGRFAFSLLFPHPLLMQTDLQEKEWFNYTDGQGRPVRVSGYEHYDELRQLKTETAIRRIIEPDGKETVLTAPLALRYTFPQELERLLEGCGLAVVERYGDAQRSPLTDDSRFMVYVCGKVEIASPAEA